MAGKQTSNFRISTLAKDLGLKTKDLCSELEAAGIPVKSNSAILTPEEVNLLFEQLTQSARIHDIDGYMSGKTNITLPESPETAKKRADEELAAKRRAEAEAEAKAKAEAEAAEAARRAEEERIRREAEEKRLAEEAEAKHRAEEAARLAAEAEAERQRLAAEAAERAERERKEREEREAREAREKQEREEAEALRKAEEEAKIKAEAAKKAEQEASKNNGQESMSGHMQQDGQGKAQNNAGANQKQGQNAGVKRDGQQGQNRDRNGQNQNRDNRDNRDRRLQNQGQNNQGTQNSQRPNGQRDGNRDTRPGQSQQNFQNSGNQQRPNAPQKSTSTQNTQTEGAAKKRTGGIRVVDTRSSSVDLSKYDERLDSFSTGIDDTGSNKQKLKKQNQRGDNRGTGRKSDKERAAMEKLRRDNLAKAKKAPLKISIPDEISVGELAQRLKIKEAECVKRLMMMGMMVTVNQIIDYDTAYLVADELGAQVTKEVTVTIEDKLFTEAESSDEDLVTRAPIVCVMGHVDHGKTSILDAIRNSHVTAGEAGGITQHIGAYRVSLDGRDITFLDTPGHEAFTAMRARGAQCTDIAILVVAGDDGIMPQTVEAINHAKAAGVDIIVAINKMDKPHANAETVMTELTKYDLVPEEWGGDVMCVPVSAVTKMGINDLLEDILLIADVKEYKANPHKRAKGVVIEAKLDRGRGPVATVLVQDGTLHAGDIVIAGTSVGRVRAMNDDRGRQMTEAGPSVPVEIIGLAEVPIAGDEFNAVEDERMARELADQRREKAREAQFNASAKVSLDDLFSQISEGVKELNIIVKADVVGSAEAVRQSLEKISSDEVKVRVIHAAVGGITESDVMLAAASNAIIVGFNVRPDKGALDSAERQNVDIRTYRVIYDCIEEITAAMKGMLAPTYKEVLLGHISVRQTIRVPNVGIIAGSYVQDGKVTRQSQIRIVRDGVVIMEDKISSLRRFKDDVREVAAGYECGIGLEKCLDIQVGDILEAYIMEEVARG